MAAIAAKRAAVTRKALERFSKQYREVLDQYRRSQVQVAAWKGEAHSMAAKLEELRQRALAAATRDADARALRAGIPAASGNPSLTAAEPSRRARLAVSIVLGTYNRLETLRLAIDSIRRQRFAHPHEIVVVDGGSTDGTIEWLSKQTDIILILQHNRVPGRKKRSWGYFMNLAFKAAEGKYVLMLSDDCLLVPGSIENAVCFADRLESEGRPIGGVAFYFRNWPADQRYFVQCTLGGMLMVNHGLFAKEALTAVGFAEEDVYEFYKADSDLALKLWHAGYEIVACPEAFVEHLLREDEDLRITNNATLDHDRQALIDRWSGVFVHPDFVEAFNPPKRIELDFVDSHNTVEAFAACARDDPAHRATASTRASEGRPLHE